MRIGLLTLCIQTVHHPAYEFQFVLQAKVNEICVDENAVWRNEGIVVLQKKRRSNLSSDEAENYETLAVY